MKVVSDQVDFDSQARLATADPFLLTPQTTTTAHATGFARQLLVRSTPALPRSFCCP